MPFQNWHKEFNKFWTEHLKVSKTFALIGSFWAKYILFELQKYRGVIFHDTEELCKFWRKTDLWFEKRLEKFGKISTEHLKRSKLGLWWDPFIQSRKGMTLKFTEELCVMTMKKNTKFEKELTCHFKTDMRNLRILTPALENLKKLVFNWLLWPKYIMFQLRKVQRSYVWWHWRLMQNLKKKWLALSKMTGGIWQAFKNDLKNLANIHRLK